MQLGLQTEESPPAGRFSVLKVGWIMVIVTDNQGMPITSKKSM